MTPRSRIFSDRFELEAKRLLIESTDAKTQAAAARLANAEASGRLAAYQEQARLMQSGKHPTTQPTTQPLNLVQRIANAMAGE